MTLRGHSESIEQTAFSPDGTRLLTAATDGTVRVWRARDGRCLSVLQRSDEALTPPSSDERGRFLSASFGPKGVHVLTKTEDYEEHVWDAVTGKVLGKAAELSQDPAFAWVSERYKAHGKLDELLWTIEGDQEPLFRGHFEHITAARFSPDRRRIATCSADHTIRLWDAGKGREHVLFATGQDLAIVQVRPESSEVLTVSKDASRFHLWNVLTTRSRVYEGHSERINAVSFDRNGGRLVTASDDNTAAVWNLDLGAEPTKLLGHTDRVVSAAFGPQGQRILTVSKDRTARVWDARTGAELLVLRRDIWQAAFDSTGRRIVTTSGDAARVWDVRKGDELLTMPAHRWPFRYVRFADHDRRILTMDATCGARVWDTATGALLSSGSFLEMGVGYGASADGTRVICRGSMSADPPRLVDTESGIELPPLRGHTQAVFDVAFSPDGQRIVTCSLDQTARVWDAATGAELVTLGCASSVKLARFSPDGTQIVTATSDGEVEIWDSLGRYPLWDPES